MKHKAALVLVLALTLLTTPLAAAAWNRTSDELQRRGQILGRELAPPAE